DVAFQLELFGVRRVPSVYLGGGTPSTLGPDRITRLLDGLSRLLPPPQTGTEGPEPREITVEANPETADRDFLAACAAAGVTRVSLGVQSFDAAARSGIGRSGTPERVCRGLALAAELFPGRFSADLISGLPFQDLAVLKADVARLSDFGPEHVSLYGLILEPGTPLYRKRAETPLPTDDLADDLWISGRDLLEEAGLSQYEVSNFARPGRESVHNIRYWRMESWLAAGPSASATVIGRNGDGTPAGRRYTYPEDLDGYLASPGPLSDLAECRALSPDDLLRESLLMGFRYREGPDEGLFRERFGMGIRELIPETIGRWRSRGFFRTESSLGPSPSGLLFVNAFIRDAFTELDK
ncbi:MAG: coproporphyrinogen III oxidase family protein, partial [Treponema sp.]|nr:coproporphyrinogen III oxidase family protein [Treponema sp.]